MCVTKPTAVIFDVDKTLCDTSSIWYLAEEGLRTKNFDAFHEASRSCPAIGSTVIDLWEAYDKGYQIFIVTARQENYRHTTIEWMRTHGIVFDSLLMRATGDHRPDPIVKYEILQHLQQHFDIVHAWEDNPEVVALWEREGIPVTIV